MRKFFQSTILIVFIISLSGLPALGCGGGGGGGGGGGEGAAGTGVSGSPPTGFTPLDVSAFSELTFQVPTQSVEPTPVTSYVEAPLPDIDVDEEKLTTALVIGGGIAVGYATSGLSIGYQALAAGGYSATATAIQNSDKPQDKQSSTVYSGTKDTAIAFIPVPPPVQAAISLAVDKAVEMLPDAPPDSRPGGYGQTYSR